MKTKILNHAFLLQLVVALIVFAATASAQETLEGNGDAGEALTEGLFTAPVDPAKQPPPDSSNTVTESAPGYAAKAADVPNCVWIEQPSSKKITVWNDCGYQVRVKVVIAWGPDFQCYAINPGEGRWYEWTRGRFDRLESC